MYVMKHVRIMRNVKVMTENKRRELILLILDKGNNDKFSKEQINAIKTLSEEYISTEMYKKTLADRHEWIDTASANDIWLHICEKICEKPMIAGAILRILIPVLWEKVQKEYADLL